MPQTSINWRFTAINGEITTVEVATEEEAKERLNNWLDAREGIAGVVRAELVITELEYEREVP